MRAFFLAGLLFATPAFAQELKIRVGSSPVLSSAGIYLADEKGYFKEQGLTVEITDVANSGAPMTVLLAKGEIEVGAGNLTSGLFNAVADGFIAGHFTLPGSSELTCAPTKVIRVE